MGCFELPDSGAREEWDTGSRRDSQEGKGRYDLLSWHALERIAKHMESGSKKYGDRNWEKGQPLGRYLNSAMRHLIKWASGEQSEDHLAASCWNIMAMMHTANEINKGNLPLHLGDGYELRNPAECWTEKQNECLQTREEGTQIRGNATTKTGDDICRDWSCFGDQ